MLQEKIAERKLPELLQFQNGSAVKNAEDWKKRRAEILDILRKEIYGYSPKAPEKVTGTLISSMDSFYADKGTVEEISISFPTPKGEFSFPIHLILPKKVKPAPAFLHISFHKEVPSIEMPTEEILDHGYAVISFCYNDVSLDNPNDSPVENCFTGVANGLADHYPREQATGWGKIGIWAWAASRVMDYICTRPEIDHSRVAVVGHSRLGKTALWCGAQDERFSMVCSNNSGCGGAALFRDKIGEKVAFMRHTFPFWFCDNYCTYGDREHEMPWDQHFLLSLIAPRGLVVTSATEDDWADPTSEFLSAYGASPAFKLCGQPGLLTEDRMPKGGEQLIEGNPGYFLRVGSHYLSRLDWQTFIAFREKNGGRF